MKKFWNWINQTEQQKNDNEPRVLILEGPIDADEFWGDEVTPKMFKDELNAGTGDIVVYINSPGGDCIAASQIYTMLMEYKGSVTIKIDGLAASAASVVAMAGEKVLMAPTALLMIHNPMTIACGNKDDMKQAIAVLDEVKETIINAYEIKSGLSRDKISHLMDNETWMNARKAIELGFADGLIHKPENEDSAQNEMAGYDFSARAVEQRVMNRLTEKYKPTTPPVEEKEETPEQSEEPVKMGRSFDELMSRLNLIKN